MNKSLFTLLLIGITSTAFAQRELKDSVIQRMKTDTSGMIFYMDSIQVKGHNKAQLDSAAKKWFHGYFLYADTNVNRTNKPQGGAIFNRGVFEFKCMPGYVYVPFYGIMTIQVICKDNFYSYRITDLYFRPHNGFLNAIGYQRNPNYLLKLYYKKHLSFGELMNVDKRMIRAYLFSIDEAVHKCISSLNTAMIN